MRDLFQVIKTIRLSEKATLLGELHNEYVLEIDRRANKLEVKEAVERILKKKVADVRTCNYKGKPKSRSRRVKGRTPQWKKAYVRLQEGESIELV